ncbi:peptidylprolyl isomerase [Haloimpatiens sp. FM7330]|uniref:peptidylprolyl isomerase n=1 Tax=Haloimpatiens sp. FM7330 TaxID=3298610 RepID=UPI00363F0B4B
MNNIKKIIISAVACGLIVSLAGCKMIKKTPEAIKNETVAKVAGEKITRGEVDNYPQMAKAIEAAEKKYGKDYENNTEAAAILKETRQNVLEQMSMEKIIMKKADELKVEDSKKINEEVTKQFNEMKKTYKNDEKKFKEDLKQGGFTEETLKEFIKIRVIAPKVYDKALKDVKANEKEIKDYYDSHLLDFTEKPNRIHVSHILVKTEEEAKKAKARLDKGEDFAKVAKEVSTDKTANEKGGDLGFIKYNDPNYDRMFMTAAQALKEGTVSTPVKTQFGWHIIKCIKKEEYPIKKLADVKKQVEEKVVAGKKSTEWKKILEQWKKDAKIKIYDAKL